MLDLPADVRKENGRWIRVCPTCGVEISHLRRNYCIHSSILRQPCKRCSNHSNNPSGMCGPVRIAWYNSFYKSAISRGYSWGITIYDVANLHVRQDGKCALTGWPIGWADRGWGHSASLDRVDNGKGYELGNVQLVHKKVNMARGSMSVADFVDMCSAVAAWRIG